MVFLGTPHRGAELAKLLNGILSFGFAKRPFVKDLIASSQAIKEIDDVFGEVSSTLGLASFWESQGMPVIGVSLKIVKY
jgi:hypothetical protein